MNETNDRFAPDPKTENHSSGEKSDEITPERKPEDHSRKRRLLIITAIVLGLGTLGAFLWWLHARNYETTDDAFIDVHVVQIASQVSGRVKMVAAKDNQDVHTGDLLVEIDPADYQARLDQALAAQATATAALAQAKAQANAAAAAVEEAQAETAAAEANEANATRQLTRNRPLVASKVISPQQLDTYTANAKSAVADLAAARKKVAASEAQVNVAYAQIESAKADQKNADALVEQAKLNLSYCHVVAFETGRIAQKTVAVGNYIQAGQNLMTLVPTNVWVTANYKETQIDHMRPGQKVTIEVDAYPDKEFRGHIDSIQSGGGAAFSLLPPENATGNYIKIVQRVPVKIVFDDPPDPQFHLGPGMSVVPTVEIR